MIDPEQLRYISSAAEELACREGPLRERLLAAARRLDAALPRRERWPGHLLQRAQQIQAELNSAGSFEATIHAMELAVAERLAERILHLYADFQIAAHEARHTGRVVSK